MSTSCAGGECCENKTCNNNNKNDDSTLCLAVVRENGADVVLFDATGVPRSFTYKGDPGKLCFSTHGHGQVDDLLTPCLDEDGKHGVPEESCFCGVDEPHLHAHMHDPKTCDTDKQSNGGDGDLERLARLTLLRTDENEQDETLYNLSVSASLPKECNSKELSQHRSQHGYSLRQRRMHKIQHDDHVDYLVHDQNTGDLHLEHPCNDCGDTDVHGRFKFVSKRKFGEGEVHFFEVVPFHILEHLTHLLQFNPTTERVMAARPEAQKPCCKDGVCSMATALVDEDFDLLTEPNLVRSTFECAQIRCSSEIPMINSVLEPMSGVKKVLINVPVRTVHVDHDPSLCSGKDIEEVLNKNHFGATIQRDGAQSGGSTTVGRSQFFVQRICCASEIPAIRAIVEPLAGVSKVTISVTTKMVYVEHDTALVSATDIADALNDQHFGAQVKHNAADDVRTPLSAFVKSTLGFESPTSSNSEPDMQVLKDFLSTFDSTQMETFVVDVPAKKITVVHNPHILSAEAIVKTLAQQTGIQAVVQEDGAANTQWDFPQVQEEEEEIPEETASRPSYPTILSGIFWVISMFSLIGGNWEYLKYVALVSVAFGLPSIGIKAFRTLRRFQFDTNVLMFVAAVGALALQEFTEAAAVTFLFSISEWLEVRATTRARNALSAIVKLRPDKANLIHPSTKEIMVVPAASVPVGALVSVRTGDKIPCDGVVVEGRSTVDESSLTGESRPVRKGPQDQVSGGTINSGNTQLIVRTTSTADNSAVARLIRLVEEAQANRSPTEKLVDEFAKRYTPVVILAALFMCTIPWAFGRDIGRQWTNNGLVLIVVACPCALIISTPVTYVAGLAASAQRGVLVKGGAHLEALGMVKTIAFDKTGTLTQGAFALLHLNTFGENLSREEKLQYLVVMEERASHPLAQAVLQAAQNEDISIPKGMAAIDHTNLAGEGVTAMVNGKTVHVGNKRLFRRLGLYEQMPLEQKQSANEWASLGGTVAFMSIEGSGIVCSFCVADAVRPESAEVVKSLIKLGIEPIMLTGDNRDAALAIGSQVGLNQEQIRSQLLPEDKLTLVTELKEESSTKGSGVFSNPCRRHYRVLMCGDGVNDAPALAAADVGVAMGAGAALAMETSDVTLLDSKLDKLVYGIRMGKRVLWKIRENVVFSLVTKIIVVVFALLGRAELWAAIATDVGAMIVVTLNGMLLLPSKKKSNELADQNEMHDDLVDVLDVVEEAATGTHVIEGALHAGIKPPANPKPCCSSSDPDPCCASTKPEPCPSSTEPDSRSALPKRESSGVSTEPNPCNASAKRDSCCGSTGCSKLSLPRPM